MQCPALRNEAAPEETGAGRQLRAPPAPDLAAAGASGLSDAGAPAWGGRSSEHQDGPADGDRAGLAPGVLSCPSGWLEALVSAALSRPPGRAACSLWPGERCEARGGAAVLCRARTRCLVAEPSTRQGRRLGSAHLLVSGAMGSTESARHDPGAGRTRRAGSRSRVLASRTNGQSFRGVLSSTV